MTTPELDHAIRLCGRALLRADPDGEIGSAAGRIVAALSLLGVEVPERREWRTPDWRRAQGLLAHALTALHRARLCATEPALPGVAIGYVREATGCMRDALDVLCEEEAP